MRLIGHRGYHNKEIEANSILALKKCLEKGYGLETDLRDYQQQLVISHNIADKAAPFAQELFSFAQNYKECTLALNIKADGLDSLLLEHLKNNNIANYFVFDMSVPQMIEYYQKGIRFFTRKSEYEEIPVMYQQAAGVWVDAFEREDWIQKELIMQYLQDGKQVCIVSPELHHKNPLSFWEEIKAWEIHSNDIMLCTDNIEEAKEFFKTFEIKEMEEIEEKR